MSAEDQRKPISPDAAGLIDKPAPLESTSWAKFNDYEFTGLVGFDEFEPTMPEPKRKEDGRWMDYVIISRSGERFVASPTYMSAFDAGTDLGWHVLDTELKGFSDIAVVAWKELVPPEIDPDTPPASSPNWEKYSKYGVSRSDEWDFGPGEVIPGAKQGRNGRMQRYTLITRHQGRLMGIPDYESPFAEGEATGWVILNEKAHFRPDRYKPYDRRDVMAWQELHEAPKK